MTRTQWNRLAWVCIVALGPAIEAAAQTAEKAGQAEMSVDVSITHAVLDDQGNPVLPGGKPTVFTLARAQREAGWQTTVTYRRQTGAPTRASAHPLDGARVEFDEASRTTRVYDSTGELNPFLSNDSTGGLPATNNPGDWLEGLVAGADGRAARSRGLQQKYGKAVGRVRGLDRFLSTRDDTLEEVLEVSISAFTIEIYTLRDGVLEHHMVFEYDRRPDGAWVRRRMRTEQLVPGASGHRSRMTVEFTNLSMAGR